MPLRSASDFPASPAPEALDGTYQECRAALVSANRSRGVLKAQSDRRGVVIAELRRELVEMFRRLMDQATRWRTVKARAAALAAEAAKEGNPSNQIGGQR